MPLIVDRRHPRDERGKYIRPPRKPAPSDRLLEGFCPDAEHGRLVLEEAAGRDTGRCDGCQGWWRAIPPPDRIQYPLVGFLVISGEHCHEALIERYVLDQMDNVSELVEAARRKHGAWVAWQTI